jgi:hypothetical protein
MVDGYNRDNVTDVEWSAREDADRASLSFNALLVLLGVTGQIG